MATRRTRSTRSTRTSTSRSSGGGLARFLLPAAALGIGAYLLWPRTAAAAVLPPPGPAPGPPNPLPPPPAGRKTRPDAQFFTPEFGEGRALTALKVRTAPATTSPEIPRAALQAGDAVVIWQKGIAPGDNQGGTWWEIVTPSGDRGFARGVDAAGTTNFTTVRETTRRPPGVATAGYFTATGQEQGQAVAVPPIQAGDIAFVPAWNISQGVLLSLQKSNGLPGVYPQPTPPLRLGSPITMLRLLVSRVGVYKNNPYITGRFVGYETHYADGVGGTTTSPPTTIPGLEFLPPATGQFSGPPGFSGPGGFPGGFLPTATAPFGALVPPSRSTFLRLAQSFQVRRGDQIIWSNPAALTS